MSAIVLPTPRQIKKFGWRPSSPDKRDIHFQAAKPVPLPTRVDLRPKCPSVYDQGDLGSCTANALAAAFEFDLLKQGKTDFMPSRLFIYYNERYLEGTVSLDAGAELRDGMKVLANFGTCDEYEWKYDIYQFATQPPTSCYNIAAKHKIPCYSAIDNTKLYLMQQCLAKGLPFVYGFSVYESFESDQVASTGIMPMPSPNESIIGGHAVMAVGYDNYYKRFMVRNSWGPNWGIKGYFTVPYEFMTNKNLTTDAWMISSVN